MSFSPSLRAKRSNPFRRAKEEWIATSLALLAMTALWTGASGGTLPAAALFHCVAGPTI
jgi:hypothetical protein